MTHLTADQLAAQLGIQPNSVHRFCRDNGIPYQRVQAPDGYVKHVYDADQVAAARARARTKPRKSYSTDKARQKIVPGACIGCGCTVDVRDGYCVFCRQDGRHQ